jgi:hypothetical protein
MAFYEDKSLISGSICGRVNVSDLENMEKATTSSKSITLKFSKCQNCQDRKIPIASVSTSDDFGLGMALDIEGNCRFYDLIRFKKMAKINSGQVRLDEIGAGKTKFRLLDNVCVEMTQDAFIGIIQSTKIYNDFSDE